MRLQTYVVIGLWVFCAGCGESNEAEQSSATDRETVFDPLTDTLERARGVEDTLRQSAEERRRQLEEDED